MAFAHALMRKHGIRHLPVLHSGKVVGLVSERDLEIFESTRDAEADSTTVEEAMSTDVYVVSPAASLADVADVMAARKLGSAVIVDRGCVTGVFTTTDALRVLAASLR